MRLADFKGQNLEQADNETSVVQVDFQIQVKPRDQVTASYMVTIESSGQELSSLTTAFVVASEGVLLEPLNGNDLELPPGFSGGEVSGNLSLSFDLFPELDEHHSILAVLSGTTADYHGGILHHFWFARPVELG